MRYNYCDEDSCVKSGLCSNLELNSDKDVTMTEHTIIDEEIQVSENLAIMPHSI